MSKPIPKNSTAGYRKRRGVAAVEFAVCLPVIMLLVVGTIEACSMVFLKQAMTVAAYEGARTALESGATTAKVLATSNQVLADRHVQGGTVSIKPKNFESLKPGEFVDVTVSAPCSLNSIVPIRFYKGHSVSATASMMIEY